MLDTRSTVEESIRRGHGRAAAKSPRRRTKPSTSDEALNARSRYFEELRAMPVLDQEQEVALARQIEQGEEETIQAIASSSAALAALATFAADLRSGNARLVDVAAARGEEGADETQSREELAQLLESIAPPDGSEIPIERHAAIAEALTAYRFTPRVVERVLARLDASPADAEAVVADAIRRHRAEADDGRAKLVRANMRLVVWMAKRQMNRGLPLLDLVQEGNVGLMRAAEKFDYRRGVRFNTYAVWWIRQAINRSLSNHSRTIRMPVYLLETRRKLAHTLQRFVHEHGREATAEEAAAASGVPVSKIRELWNAPKEPISMDSTVGPDSDSKLGDMVPDGSAVSPFETIASERLASQMRRMLQTLNEREQQVLKMRFGLDHEEHATLQEIGNRFALSRERIRQIEVEALGKLREQAESEELDSYLTG